MEVINWEPGPAQAALAGEMVDVWRARLKQPAWVVERLAGLLSPRERQRAERIRIAERRESYVTAQAMLRVILGRYTGLAPEEIVFATNAFGKPYLPAQDHRAPLRFNHTDSGDWSLVALSANREVGVDLEKTVPREGFERIVARYFAEDEKAAFFALPPEERLSAFYYGWTAKEAFLKAKGVGLTYSLRKFSVSLRPDEPPGLLGYPDDPAEVRRWSFRRFTPFADAVATLVLAGDRPFALDYFDLMM